MQPWVCCDNARESEEPTGCPDPTISTKSGLSYFTAAPSAAPHVVPSGHEQCDPCNLISGQQTRGVSSHQGRAAPERLWALGRAPTIPSCQVSRG